ncbi:ABC transporter ATP-binding protein [Flindersiella endophytica]
MSTPSTVSSPRPSLARSAPAVTRILRELAAYRLRIAFYVLLLVAAAAGGVCVPLLTQRLIDDGLVPRTGEVVVTMSVAILAVGLAGAAARSAGGAFGFLIGGQLGFDLRVRLYRHLQRMPLAFFARSQSGALLSRISTDVVAAQGLLQMFFGTLVGNLVAAGIAVAAMVALDPLLTLLVLAFAPLLLVPARLFSGRLLGYGRLQAEESKRMMAHLTERLNVGGALTGLVFGHRERDLAAFSERAAASRDAWAGRNVMFAKAESMVGVLGICGYAAVTLVGGLAAVRGAATVGTVVALVGLVRLVYDPLVTIVQRGLDLTSGLVAFERVYEVLDLEPAMPEPSHPVRLSRATGRVEFRDVWFRFPEPAEVTLPSLLADPAESFTANADRPVWALRDVSWTAEPSTMTAVVGPTGVGKTTLTSLVSRLYDPTRGSIRLDGVDLRDLSAHDRWSAIGVVSQDAYLFNDTLAVNLRLAHPDATLDELRDACERAQLGDLVDRLPDGFDTVVGDRGYRLSGGEKQRVALARVFLTGARVVVLDEATAHLDTQTEAAVQTALAETLRGCTLIVVAHRLTTIRGADQVLEVNNGTVTARRETRSGGPISA